MVLINGEGQGEVEGTRDRLNAGRIVVWKNTEDLVYVCSDVRNAYVNHPDLESFERHFLCVRNRFFVVCDDLRLKPEADPATFSWLYQVLPDVPVEIRDGGFDYVLNDVNVQVHHFGETGPLEILNMSGDNWYRNPITGVDHYEKAQEQVIKKKEGVWVFFGNLPRVHNNLWVNTEPRREAKFLSVIVPFQKGEQEPKVQKLAPGVISVKMDGECEDVIAFGQMWDGATVIID